MRKQYLLWTIAVFGIFSTICGAYLFIYHLNNGNGLLIPALVLLICGFAALVLFFTLYIITLVSQSKRNKEQAPLESDVIEEKEVNGYHPSYN